MSDDQKGKALPPSRPDLTDQDIYEAMKAVPGYLDITPADFKEVYLQAYQHALERLSRSVTAQAIMTKEVVRVKPDTPLMETAEMMARAGVSGVPVVDEEDRVVGLISEKDFLIGLSQGTLPNIMSVVAQCLQVKKCPALSIRGRTAKDIMTSPSITIGLETSLKEISEIFSSRTINRAPVVDSEGRLLGIVSRGDIVKAERGWPKSC
ncbi:MAG: CBS domain-containing protein [Thermodesulfobacteriota bacterium]